MRHLSANPSFGSGTAAAVRSFQTANALDPDAVVGLNTWSRLLA